MMDEGLFDSNVLDPFVQFLCILKDELVFSAASKGAVRQSNRGGVGGVQLLVEVRSFRFSCFSSCCVCLERTHLFRRERAFTGLL